ncbi:hypothetical protein [Pseudomonas sp. B21-010]|uniref:hypothetical protein n=1 Tax=Pseudomonas sp. B21-010 TaxID=2895471 RepID=UPI00215EB4A8|nr:hypothetical protein [Pseudomonas sp. B21-010]UVM63307.1 hypothetical protein LOY50_09780 [Pseudomonas sp. B21-010]
MSARDRNAARYLRDEGLNNWSLRWVLDGNMLLCALCGVGQFARDAGEPFQHGAGCAIDSECAKHPWHALAALLSELPVLTSPR